uniref:EB domain-containing protein n=1 Tax=Anisakis simplex TaxID=6269 RepID=A0A0M3K0P0_ANISI
LNSKCLNGSCVCPEQFDTSASGFCTNATSKTIKKGLAGSHCSANSSCASSTLLCSSSEHCICSDGFIGDGHGDCSKIAKPFARSSSLPQFTEVLPGESCMNGEKCIGGSMCVFGKCACRSGIARRGLMCHSEIHPFKRSLSDQHSNRIHRFNGVRSHQRHTMITACPSDGSCQLPDCYCSRTGMEIPGGYNASEIPQMVVLTFEGAVTDRIIQMYKSLFTGRFRNPNGCPIQATFFITHEWNNYDQSQWLMSTGHEIGVSSMTGDVLNQTSKQRWHAEMNGMREALGLFSYVPVNEIIGLRAPRHQLGGDNQFSTMLSSDFKYDSTTSFSGGPYWPQTLDYKLAWECSENGCPQKPYPGLWELPISPLKRLDSRDESTTVKDMVKSGDSPNDIATMLEKNFRRHYYNNRAPFVIAIDSDYLTSLQDNGALKALEIFIEQVHRINS